MDIKVCVACGREGDEKEYTKAVCCDDFYCEEHVDFLAPYGTCSSCYPEMSWETDGNIVKEILALTDTFSEEKIVNIIMENLNCDKHVASKASKKYIVRLSKEPIEGKILQVSDKGYYDIQLMLPGC